MNSSSVLQNLLSEAYSRNGSNHVAFIDETFRGQNDFPGESGFYVLTAVIVNPLDFEVLRNDLEEIAEGTFWHSTVQLKTVAGRTRMASMLQYLNKGDEISVVSEFIDPAVEHMTTEDMRKKCFTNLCANLFGAGNPWPQIQLAILERRNEPKLFSLDENYFRSARSTGLIPPHARLLQVTPQEERLLWLPDTVSSAVRQERVWGNKEFIDLVRSKLHILEIK